MDLTLVSHPLCPYVQRAAIVLLEKGVPFERRWVDLAATPAWFTAISPLGQTPVLLAGAQPLFESAVICDYLDDILAPRLHPGDALLRARHRGWVEFGSSVLATIGAYYAAPDAQALRQQHERLVARFERIEEDLHPQGPYFAGDAFCMVDAAFAPVFRYLDAFDGAGEEGFLAQAPRVRAWRAALAMRPSVRDAVAADFPTRLQAFLAGRGSELARRMEGRRAAMA